jgi:DNA-binding LytR/AlgR family response regulator
MHFTICDDEPVQCQSLMAHIQAWPAARRCLATAAIYGSAEAFLFELEGDRAVDVLLCRTTLGRGKGDGPM